MVARDSDTSGGGFLTLDCTLRDGGFYCEWDFDADLVEGYLDGVNEAGIDVVELGYRAPTPAGYFGRYKLVPDSVVSGIVKSRGFAAAVMVDVKDLVGADGRVDLDMARRLFAPAATSPVRLVRLAFRSPQAAAAAQLTQFLKDGGHTVSHNLMGISKTTPEDRRRLAASAARCGADIVYFADTYGSLLPEQVGEIITNLRWEFTGAIGAHCHDNLGLALANSLEAVRHGARYVDGTVAGMGRGPGNLRIEQLLLLRGLREGGSEVRLGKLFACAARFEELKTRFGWGVNVAYMLSGAYGVHPTYVQELLGERYSFREAMSTLQVLRESGKGNSYSEEELARALDARYQYEGDTSSISVLSSLRSGAQLSRVWTDNSRVLVIGAGPSVARYRREIQGFIDTTRPVVLECNGGRTRWGAPAELDIVINLRRLRETVTHSGAPEVPIVFGRSVVPNDVVTILDRSEVFHVPCRVTPGRFDPGGEEITIPADVVGMYAIGLALRQGAHEILLAGFDGYLAEDGTVSARSLQLQQEMQSFFRLLREDVGRRSGVSVRSILPTQYDIERASLFAYV